MKIPSEHILQFLEEVGVLKNIPRTGWRFKGIKDAESVADHSYRVTLLAMLLADLLKEDGVNLNAEKVLRIALFHELAEARIGDIPFPALEYLSEAQKSEAERAAIADMFAPFGKLGQQYLKLWDEFEESSSLEGKIVRAADKLELLIQVFEYEKRGFRDLDRFWDNPWNQQNFDVHELIQALRDALVKKRNKLIKGK